MKTRLALLAAALGLLFSLNAVAETMYRPSIPRGAVAVIKAQQPTEAPEISAESAAISIALLTGVLLLVSERSRTRRT